MKGLLKFGLVCEADAAKGVFRVKFPADDDFVSDWLPLVSPSTGANKAFFPLDINEQVAVFFEDEHAETGAILGAVWSDVDTPDGGNKDKFKVKFSDGTFVEYDRAAHKLKVKIGTTEFEMTESGFLFKRGGETLKAILDDLFSAINALTVPTSTGPSGVPINAAQFTAIKNRIPNLLA